MPSTKIKDVLLPEIKNDVSDFLQNEVKQKINLHNQEEYQAVADKKLLANLEREVNNDIRQNKSCNMVGDTWNFDVTHETSDSQSTCSTSNSEGL